MRFNGSMQANLQGCKRSEVFVHTQKVFYSNI